MEQRVTYLHRMRIEEAISGLGTHRIVKQERPSGRPSVLDCKAGP